MRHCAPPILPLSAQKLTSRTLFCCGAAAAAMEKVQSQLRRGQAGILARQRPSQPVWRASNTARGTQPLGCAAFQPRMLPLRCRRAAIPPQLPLPLTLPRKSVRPQRSPPPPAGQRHECVPAVTVVVVATAAAAAATAVATATATATTVDGPEAQAEAGAALEPHARRRWKPLLLPKQQEETICWQGFGRATPRTRPDIQAYR